jgi:hypothetical protein
LLICFEFTHHQTLNSLSPISSSFLYRIEQFLLHWKC